MNLAYIKEKFLNDRKFKSKEDLILASRKWINYRNKMGIA